MGEEEHLYMRLPLPKREPSPLILATYPFGKWLKCTPKLPFSLPKG